MSIFHTRTRGALAAALLAIALPLGGFAQTAGAPALPDTPAGRTLRAFLAALNTGDAATLRKFHADHTPEGSPDSPDELVPQDLDFFGKTGGVDLRRVEESSDYAITVVAQPRKRPGEIRIRMIVTAVPPHGPEAIEIRPAGPGPAAAAAPAPPVAGGRALTDDEIAREAAAIFDGPAAKGDFSGVVLVARDGRPLFRKAYGMADREKNVAMREDSKLNLASMNKMFTAVAVAQLAERGKLAFTDTVGKFLPDYPNKDVRDKVTVHHLLTHTSGLKSYWNARHEARKGELDTVAEYLALFADEPPAFEPGARFEYSNAGFVVLGAIVEKVSGMSYYDYVAKNVFGPAGMTRSGYDSRPAAVEGLAKGYTKAGGPGDTSGALVENTGTLAIKGAPAGGGHSTADDLLKFATALRSGKLVSAKTLETLTAPKVDNPGQGPAYGYGFGSGTVNGARWFGHNGGSPGVANDMMIFPETGFTVVVLTNRDPGTLRPHMQRLAGLVTQGR